MKIDIQKELFKKEIEEQIKTLTELQRQAYRTGYEQGKKEKQRPKVNLIAFIVNSHFLDSDYQGKDWESVRKSLIEELSELFEEEKQKLIKDAQLEK